MKHTDQFFDALTKRALEEGLLRAALIRVEREGVLLFEESWGYAYWSEDEKTPLSSDHQFDLASLSKLFTSTAILKLISSGEIEEGTRVVDLLWFRDSTLRAALKEVRIANLLDHSSGLPPWFPFYTRLNESFESILADILVKQGLKKETLYSDINYMLLGSVIERLSGKNLREAMRDLVFEPLGLRRATYDPEAARTVATEFGNRIEKRMLAERGLSFDRWRRDDVLIRGECNDGNCHYYFKGAAGHAGIFADAADVARLCRVYLDDGQSASGDYLDLDLLKVAVCNRGADRGYGFQLGANYPGGGFGHTGFTGTYLHINPAADMTITVLSNRLHLSQARNIDEYRRAVSKHALALFSKKNSNTERRSF
ncbi:MAG TPA: class C beta-lactamase-related serine hydrolase [Sediminispirochaeta sp.]|nr:class C beta-lactamase-related serine hydrolase [Sediminispirochaeta sp.]